MLAALNLLKKSLALFFAVSLFLTGGINRLFSGDVYEFDSVSSVIGLETLVRAQGVTNDGEHFYFSGKNCLEKTDGSCEEILALNLNAIPEDLSGKYGVSHIGGISFADGFIYAPLEDSKVWEHPLIALYDCETLEYTGVFFELPADKQTRGVPWVVCDGENGVAYTGDSRNYTEIHVFSLEDFSYLRTVTFDGEIEKIQGGEYYNGLLYFGTNDKTRAVYTVNPQTGATEKLFDRIMYDYKLIDNFGGEGEDLTVLPTENGAYIHTLQTGALFIDATLRHYKQAAENG